MGIGDEIMVTGEVKRLVRAHPGRKYAITDTRKANPHRWHFVWEGNPYIARLDEHYTHTLECRGGLRPYIKDKTQHQWAWKEYSPEPGELYLTAEELTFAACGRGRVVIHPTVKDYASPNKQWPHWQRMIDMAPHVPWLQLLEPGTLPLRGVRTVVTQDFRKACGVLSGASAAVLHEGGLHHAAAALGLRAVVIFGSFISPACTGYNTHRNLFTPSHGHVLGCGLRVHCPHCQAAMDGIRPDSVLAALEDVCRT